VVVKKTRPEGGCAEIGLIKLPNVQRGSFTFIQDAMASSLKRGVQHSYNGELHVDFTAEEMK
jgi:hypothetical protein